jgi:hypothetical protein
LPTEAKDSEFLFSASKWALGSMIMGLEGLPMDEVDKT